MTPPSAQPDAAPPSSKISIHVSGESYPALFYLPEGKVFQSGASHGHAHVTRVGRPYIYRAIRAICAPQAHLVNEPPAEEAKFWPSDVELVDDVDPLMDTPPGESGSDGLALYELSSFGEMLDRDHPHKKLPVLRCLRAETQQVSVPGRPALFEEEGPLSEMDQPNKSEKPPIDENKPRDIQVHWLGEMGGKRRRENTAAEKQGKAIPCRVHVQIGLALPLQRDETGLRNEWFPDSLATGCEVRILVVNIGEISEAHRIRRALSYEAAAVDLLRFLRGDGTLPAQDEKITAVMKQLAMHGEGQAKNTILVVRINNAAVFVYFWSKGEDAEPGSCVHDKAWLMFHREECAPLSAAELGQMVGYTGFVSAHLAAAMAAFLSPSQKGRSREDLVTAVKAAIRRSLMWQHAAYERGCFHMLFQRDKTENKWETTVSQDRQRSGFEHLFKEIIGTLGPKGFPGVKKEGEPPQTEVGCPTFAPSFLLAKALSPFDGEAEKKIMSIEVQIAPAVAHRTQWFMARSVASAKTPEAAPAAISPGCAQDAGTPEQQREYFTEKVLGWLTNPKAEPADSPIPIVNIGKAELTDRREIEDYLAIYQALQVYARTPTEKKPLNIAVFGAPGAGKSFGVKQVVEHIGKNDPGVYQKKEMTFNLGQFKSLNDLPAALQLVRNECLSGEIPIVFFDEFDSSFNGQAFGWLKFFLAPMQDGEFYHDGGNYKMGRAVFVFAGGVNRSFEELNGRVRNPGFCEAKGPDFISRLKAHLNVQGINKPEDDADQSRYILRRGVLLRSLVRERLGLKKEQKQPLLHPSVAKALLKIERFKHGVRSLEAIIKMCACRPGAPIGPSDLPSMDQLEMHVDSSKLFEEVDSQS